MKDRLDGIVARTTWTKSIAMGRQLGFPLRFQSLTHERLLCPIVLGWNAERSFVRRAAFRYPDASKRGGFAIKPERAGESPSCRRL